MTKMMRSIIGMALFLLVSLTLRAQKTGVMIMAHGANDQWNNLVKEAGQPLEATYPVAYAWGMADPTTLQQGIDELEAQGVTKIIAIPLFISSFSPIIRQTEFLFGMRDTLADAPMLMHHHGGGMGGMHGGADHAEMEELKPLNIKAEMVLTHALDDHDVVAQILEDRITELSTDPKTETVVLVAHGPNDEQDNKDWINTLESLSTKIQKIQEEKGIGFKQIFGVSVRDDADKAIFNQARAHFRATVRQADQFGKVLVIPVFLSSGGREMAVAERLEGLNFEWSGKTLLPDDRLSVFLENSVKDALK